MTKKEAEFLLKSYTLQVERQIDVTYSEMEIVKAISCVLDFDRASDTASKMLTLIASLDCYDISQSKKRIDEAVLIRQILMRILKDNTSMTLNEIGLIWNKNHATVLSSLKRLKDLIDVKDEKCLFKKAEIEFNLKALNERSGNELKFNF